MNTPVRGYRHSAFCIDDRGGARVMVGHLAAVGHRRIAFISGPVDNFDATERLAGVDDIPMARFVSPPLTTVRVRMAELGARALERLAAAIKAPEATPASTETMPAELVVRASCGARAPSAPGRRASRSRAIGRGAGRRTHKGR